MAAVRSTSQLPDKCAPDTAQKRPDVYSSAWFSAFLLECGGTAPRPKRCRPFPLLLTSTAHPANAEHVAVAKGVHAPSIRHESMSTNQYPQPSVKTKPTPNVAPQRRAAAAAV